MENSQHKDGFIQYDGILIEINVEGFCIKANNAITDCTGYLPDEIIGKKMKDFLVTDSNILREIESRITANKDIVVSFECIFRHKNGSPVYMMMNMLWLELYKEVICVGKKLGSSRQNIFRENEELHLLNEINKSLQHNHNIEELFVKICDIIIHTNSFILVWIGKVIEASKIEVLHKEISKDLYYESFDESLFVSYVLEKSKNSALNGSSQAFQINRDEIVRLLPKVNFEIVSSAFVILDGGEKEHFILSISSSNPTEFDSHRLTTLEKISEAITNSLCAIKFEQQRLQNIISLNKYVHEYNIILEINDQILTINDEALLINQILSILVKSGGYKLAWLAFFENNKEKEKPIKPAYYFGETDYAKNLVFDLNISEILNGPTATCILTHKTIVTNSTQDDRYYLHWKKQASEHGLNSSICIYLDIQGNEKGTIAIYSGNKNAFEAREITFLERIANNLTFAIGTIRANKSCTQYKQELEAFKKP